MPIFLSIALTQTEAGPQSSGTLVLFCNNIVFFNLRLLYHFRDYFAILVFFLCKSKAGHTFKNK